MATPNRRFNVMVEGIDERGSFYATFEVSVASESEIESILQGEAFTNGWMVVRVEEVEYVSEVPGGEVSCHSRGGRSYFEGGES